VNYSAVGSSAGIAAISGRQVDFGASDVPMNASELAAAQGGPVTQVPDALGAEGITYNLDLPAGARLHLTGPVLAAIFLGQITHWNNPALAALTARALALWDGLGCRGMAGIDFMVTGDGGCLRPGGQHHARPVPYPVPHGAGGFLIPLITPVRLWSPVSGFTAGP
jgi:hypothetical protein